VPEPISDRQRSARSIELQRAAAVVHRRVQKLEALRYYISIGFAGLGLLATLSSRGTALLALGGLAWSLVSFALLLPTTQTLHRLAVTIQEMFDTELFRLPWNRGLAGARVAEVDIRRLERRLPVDGRTDGLIRAGWYVDTSGIPCPYDVLICQLENLGWDTRLRRWYGRLLRWSVGIWLVAGVLIGLALHISVEQLLLLWFVPSIAIVALALELSHRQAVVAADKDRLLRLVSQALEGRDNGNELKGMDSAEFRQFVRNVQDGIFLARLGGPRVPYLVYLLFRVHDERDFADVAESYRARLRATAVTSKPP
jgi:hypothetical protein